MLKSIISTVFLILTLLYILSCNRITTPEFEVVNFDKKLGNCDSGSCIDLHFNYHIMENEFKGAEKYNALIEHKIFSKMGSENENLTKEQYIDRLVKDFEAFKKEYPDASSGGYQQHSQTEITFTGTKVISVQLISNIYAGGAHAMNYMEFINIDPASGNPVQIKDFLKNYNDFSKFAEEKLRTQLKMSPYDRWSDFTLVDKFSLPENMGFTDSGLTLIYNEYELLPFSDGPVKIELTKEELAPFLETQL
jgi:hypothetical protein